MLIGFLTSRLLTQRTVEEAKFSLERRCLCRCGERRGSNRFLRRLRGFSKEGIRRLSKCPFEIR